MKIYEYRVVKLHLAEAGQIRQPQRDGWEIVESKLFENLHYEHGLNSIVFLLRKEEE